MTFMTTVVAYLTVPSDVHERRKLGVKMDWLGSGLSSAGLILIVYAITDSSHAPRGWASAQIYSTLIVGSLLLCLAVYVEKSVATAPLVPSEMFKIKYMKPLFLGLFFSYGSLGIYMLYATL